MNKNEDRKTWRCHFLDSNNETVRVKDISFVDDQPAGACVPWSDAELAEITKDHEPLSLFWVRRVDMDKREIWYVAPALDKDDGEA